MVLVIVETENRIDLFRVEHQNDSAHDEADGYINELTDMHIPHRVELLWP